MSIDESILERVALRFRALSEPLRLRLLMQLQDQEHCVGDLARALGCGQASTSKHLALLRQAGLVAVRREGNQAFYSVRDPELFQLCNLVCGGVRRWVSEESAFLSVPSPEPS